MAVVNGNEFDNTLIGNDNEADVISGFAGNDFINALTRPPAGGGDVVSGGDGFDTLGIGGQGFAEAISLAPDSGTPTTFFVRSTAGSFFVDATSIERVVFEGGNGDDVINTGTIVGGVIKASSGIDLWLADLSRLTSAVIYRTNSEGSIPEAGFSHISGIDRISLTTGSGNDQIGGGNFADAIATGDGSDTVNAGMRDPAAGGDFVNMGAGFDTLDVFAQNEQEAVSLTPDSGNPTTFFVRSASNKFFIDAVSVERIRIQTGSGDDTINSGSIRADINTGSGIDHWIVDASALTTNINFTLGFTTAFPNSTGVNSTVANIDRITMQTGSGNDFIVGGRQGDSIVTGAGNDTVNAGSRQPSEGGDFVNLGTDFDTLIVNAATEAAAVNLTPDSGTNTTFFVRSVSNNFFVDVVSAERVEFTGGDGGDTINTGVRGSLINGGLGMDHWIADLGFATNDIVFQLGTTNRIPITGFGLVSVFNIERITLTTGSGNDRITGGAQADTILTGAGNDIVDARSRPPSGGGDFVNLGAGTDTLIVNAAAETRIVSIVPDSGGSSTFFVRSVSNNFFVDAVSVERVQFSGGSGNDVINTGIAGVAVDGNDGIDHWLADLTGVNSNIRFNLGTTTEITAAGLKSIGDIEQISLSTGAGDDIISGGRQADTIRTGAGNDTVDLRTRPTSGGGDFADLGAGIDTLVVDASKETQSILIVPNSSNPTTFFLRSTSNNFFADVANAERIVVEGGGGGDTLTGSAGLDRLTGNAGADTFTGGGDGDLLDGGGGADTFDYNQLDDSRPGNFDRIAGFNSLDTLDLHDIDANVRVGGNQDFTFIGGQAFHGVAGELRLSGGLVEGDTNGNGVRDFLIEVPGVASADILV